MVPAKQFHLKATTARTSGESYASYVPIFAELRATSFKSESADGSAEIQDPAAKSMGARKLLTSTMRNLGGKQTYSTRLQYSHGFDMVCSLSQKSSPRENDPSKNQSNRLRCDRAREV